MAAGKAGARQASPRRGASNKAILFVRLGRTGPEHLVRFCALDTNYFFESESTEGLKVE